MNKKYCIFLTILFSLFIGGILVGSLLAPDQEFSELENRYLQTPPKLSLENLESGKFMEDAEDYVNDHVIGRDFWVALKAWSERLSGKQENNGVYFGKEDTLLNRLDEPDYDTLMTSAGYVNDLVYNLNVPVYFGIIPSSTEIWSDRLPAGAPTADEKTIIDDLYDTVQTFTIDMYSALEEHKDEEIYYRTDHHWTSLGAYYGYTALMEAMGMEAVPLDESAKVTVSDSFYGTTFSTSGVRWVAPDHIDRYISGDGVKVTGYPEGSPVESSLYVDSYLDKKDKYSSFLGGNQPLCVIETEHTDAPKVLVIRDSYSDSLAPFLTQSFSEIHLFDTRMNKTSIKAYVEENDIDQVVVLYSISNFISSSKDMFLLGRIPWIAVNPRDFSFSEEETKRSFAGSSLLSFLSRKRCLLFFREK